MRLVTQLVVLTCASALTAGCGGGSKSNDTPPAADQTTPAPAETTPAATTTETTPAETAKASPSSITRPDADGDGTPDIQTFRGKVGSTFTLVGQPTYKKPSKEAVKVTVLGDTGPYSGFDLGAGRKLIGIQVRFEGVGSKRHDDAQPGGQLTVTGGETGKQTSLISAGKSPCDNPSLKLAKGKSVTECIAYDIPKSAKPRVFEYATSSGYGDTGIWKLG